MIEIIHGDATEFDFAHGAIQAMITDPPYSDHVHANITTSCAAEGIRGYKRQTLYFAALTSDLRAYIARAAALVAGWSVIYSDHESSHLWRESLDAGAAYIRSVLVDVEQEGYVDVLPWERWSQPQKSGDRPTQGFEVLTLAWGIARGRKVWNGPGSMTALRHKALRGSHGASVNKHRTEKPLDQALDLVSWFSNAPHLPWTERSQPAQDGALPVFDPCAGSGTTAQACRLLGRAFVGFELDAEWAAKAQARVTAPLSDRDRERAERWVLATLAEASRVPAPRAPDGSDIKTWERAQRRIADAEFVGEQL